MEDGVKEALPQQKEPRFLAKAGWIKKGQGKLLASYKDRYIHVEKTELVVYENEDLQNCMERIDLENYEKCHELKSPFKKKHRLIIIRSPKPGNKVHDVKFQAQNSAEKEVWIKALSDAICRAKNKVFDEVKVDDSSNLEHVTRTRPKGNRNRRPPTRIHMKEVADVSSDGILRLDLDLEDAMMPNGTNHLTVDGSETPQKSVTIPTPASNTSQSEEEEAEPEPASSPQKKVLKPPMPPVKEAKPSPAPDDEPDKTEKQILQPPMPPSKDSKPPPSEEETKPEMSPDSKKKAGPPPPTPPNKPNKTEVSKANTQPPVVPSKDKKPSQQGTEENISKDTNTSAEEEEEVDRSLSVEVSEEESEEMSKNESEISTEPQRKSPDEASDTEKSTTINEEPNEEPDSTVSDTSASSLLGEELPSNSENLMLDVSPSTDTISLSPLLCQKKEMKAEEKSVDSGQHSDDDESEASGSDDVLAASTAALRGSHVGLDVLENENHISINLKPAETGGTKPEVKPKTLPFSSSDRIKPLKPSIKPRSASIGDLLSAPEVSFSIQEPRKAGNGAKNLCGSSEDVMKLETEVAMEMENTSELLSRVSQAHRGGGGGGEDPEDLLAEALEKLKKADHVLREVKKLKLADNSRKRKSW